MNLEDFESAVKHQGGLNRRLFLSYATALTSVPFLGTSCKTSSMKFNKNPFTLGVASGDPDSNSVVLWTRLAPSPLVPGAGMPPNQAVEVDWEVFADEGMKQRVKSGTAVASSKLGYSVHVEVSGLDPDRWYWFKFNSGGQESTLGRTRTMPADDVIPDKLKIAVTSCQNYEQGYYNAYAGMMNDNVDLVFHLGDYIYEYKGKNGRVRKHIGPETESLEQYRMRYAQYRLDPLLQGMHAHCPWVVTWDDHEFDNNCAGDISEQKGINKIDYLKRRANAYQAYYEMMPLRKTSIPSGYDMKLYRSVNFGRLAEFYVLDTRQYRTDQPNGDGKKPLNDAARNSQNSLLGGTQKQWLKGSLSDSPAVWNVLAQQVMMGMVNRQKKPQGKAEYSMDQWCGYVSERMELVKYFKDHGISNPVVLTGDIHCNWVNELRVDDLRQESKAVATEFVATSLSSGGNGRPSPKHTELYYSNNPFVKFYNTERGYLFCEITPQSWTCHFKVVDDVSEPGGRTFLRESYIVNAGNPSAYKL